MIKPAVCTKIYKWIFLSKCSCQVSMKGNKCAGKKSSFFCRCILHGGTEFAAFSLFFSSIFLQHLQDVHKPRNLFFTWNFEVLFHSQHVLQNFPVFHSMVLHIYRVLSKSNTFNTQQKIAFTSFLDTTFDARGGSSTKSV
jgi:hypothetical protein